MRYGYTVLVGINNTAMAARTSKVFFWQDVL